MKRPSFQFYPGDWLNDASLRSCSIGARGLWMDMLCFMHQGSDYGWLKVNHKVILTPNLARMVGATLPEVEGWLKELQDAGVYSIDDDGAIYSRRMVKDEEVREKRASGGILGGNPNLTKVNHKVGSKVNLQPNLPPTPSSSSSSSSSSKYTKSHLRSNTPREDDFLKNNEVEKDKPHPSTYKIENLLSEKGLNKAKANSPGWDIYHLMETYDGLIHSGQFQPPDYPDSAFPAWCLKITKGKRPV